MVNKRPFHDEGIYEVGCKNPRQQGDPEPYLNEGIARCDSPQNLPSDEGERSSKKYCNEEKMTKEIPSEDLSGADELPRNASSSNGNVNDEYVNPEAAFHLSFLPHLFELGHQEASLPQPRDMYSFLLVHPPQKIVLVGPEHQAIVPAWNPQGSKSSNSCLDDDKDIEEKLVGTCLVPMPDMESCAYSSSSDRGTRDICSCLDGGSISCTGKHVTEAREQLREELGQKFGRLGLCDMGEEVGQKWSEEEEQSFNDAVRSNPASSGKNFWHILPAVFSNRTRQELVNYYFNVFMLRKRAEQNRFDPQNIDSDNDEWQVSELGMTDEDDDSDAGSFDSHEGELPEGIKMEGEPPYVRSERLDFLKFYHHMNEEDHYAVESFDQFGFPRDHEFHVWEEGEEKDVNKGGVDSYVMGEGDKGGGIDDISGSGVADSGTKGLCQFTGKTSSTNNKDHDAGDDSCMSYENQSSKSESCGPAGSRIDDGESLDKN